MNSDQEQSTEGGGEIFEVDAALASIPPPTEFDMLPDDASEPVPDTPQGRIERWQKKLLDLSLRNRLLNFRPTKQTVPCRVPDLGKFEDALAGGKTFSAYPLLEDDPVDDRQVSAEERGRIIESTVLEAFNRKQVTVELNKAEMDKRLLALFRKAKSDLQEGGTNTLFMAAGFLRWQRENENRHYRAPLLLIPIRLERRSARSNFQIAFHEDEVRFNSTLLEFLRRDFNLVIPELEGGLPEDNSGIDLPHIFSLMRKYVQHVDSLEVIEDIAISTFSFSKYLMWKDLVDRTNNLRNNRLVAHLVDNPDKDFDSGGVDSVRPDQLDDRLAPQELVTPLPADSSQLRAVVDAVNGRDFVLIGPPGTGKSQTIANIISQCLAHGKTVLFVSEKAAALDVVQRRLKAHGLGDAVLELHSNKTDRKRVLTQLSCGLNRAVGNSESENEWIEVNEKLYVQRNRLNQYARALHSKGAQGFSIFDALGWAAPEPEGFTLQFDNKDAHDKQRFDELREIADHLGRTHAATKDISPMAFVVTGDGSYSWQEQILETASQLKQATEQMISAGLRLATDFRLHVADNLLEERVDMFDRLAERGALEAVDLRAVPDLPKQGLIDALEVFSDQIKSLEAERTSIATSYAEDDIQRMQVDQMDTDWRSANASFWPFSFFRCRRVTKLLQSYATNGVASPEVDLAVLRRMQRLLNEISQNPIASIAGPDRSVKLAKNLALQAIKLREAISEIANEVTDKVFLESLRTELEAGADGALAEALLDWQAAREAFAEYKKQFQNAGGFIPENVNASEIIREIDLVLANKNRLVDWSHWIEVRSRAQKSGLATLVEKLEAGEISGPCKDAFHRAYARWWLPLALDSSEPLRQFVHWNHEEAIRNFRYFDNRAMEIAPAEVIRRIHNCQPTKDNIASNPELGILRRQLKMKRPSMSIRKLLGKLTKTLPTLTPCVLMSPLSIAQYLPAGQATFDLVIFDEASQITTWDAVGAIARARQSIVVGDPKQLPPTNFFGRSDDEDDETDSFLGDMPSILDEVEAAGIPTLRLDWHYRSQDESLIAFSNYHYYRGQLVTFPAPSTTNNAVFFHEIEGTYARGSGRTNADEAKAIVAMIGRRLSSWIELPEEERPTLGVITFNIQQQNLILDLLDNLRRNHSNLEWFFDDEREEPVIVKNLENIQGDERDVILFSVTFGPDATGKMHMNFGALSNNGGEKRLNVAITRARQEMHVFSSITADQIDVSQKRGTGVRDLKTFLDYAKRGIVALQAAESGSLGPAENPFEEAVANALRAKGWEVQTQIGVSGFRIDLAVVNPDRAGAYLAGIECDGATYHSSATARDRDKVRQGVLENLGWNILRIWSTDWFRDDSAVIERIHAELEKLHADDRASAAEEEEVAPA